MAAITMRQVVETDGELLLRDLPCRKGQHVEVTVQIEEDGPYMTGRELATSDIVGMWRDRTDIGDSSEFARRLREQAQEPRHQL